jgi:hypothetical protein
LRHLRAYDTATFCGLQKNNSVQKPQKVHKNRK